MRRRSSWPEFLPRRRPLPPREQRTDRQVRHRGIPAPRGLWRAGGPDQPQRQSAEAEVLLQIPLGAMPVANGFYTRGVYVALEPYSTQTLEYYFYFPATGKYPALPRDRCAQRPGGRRRRPVHVQRGRAPEPGSTRPPGPGSPRTARRRRSSPSSTRPTSTAWTSTRSPGG